MGSFLQRLGASALQADRRPAWALILRSPFRSWKGATSWLGGAPMAPRGFRWPRARTAKPMSFLAQIDLAALRAEPETGERPPGLPEDGALLIFIAHNEFCVVLLTQAEADASERAEAPRDLPTLTYLGHYLDSPTYPYWPVDPVAYLDRRGERPAALPERFTDPLEWLSTWGLAVVEAEYASAVLRSEVQVAQEFLARDNGVTPSNWPAAQVALIENKRATSRKVAGEGRELIRSIEAWAERCRTQDACERPPHNLLAAHFEPRRAFSEGMGSFLPRYALRGHARGVWKQIRLEHTGAWPRDPGRPAPVHRGVDHGLARASDVRAWAAARWRTEPRRSRVPDHDQLRRCDRLRG
jgi:hypothetical protein